MLTKLSLIQFMDRLASDSPAPGGGSSSALAGAQGAALVSMYCRLSTNSEETESSAMLFQQGEKAAALAVSMTRLVDLDSEAFNRVMDALKLPFSDDEQKMKRRESIHKAFVEAAEMPLKTARHCLSTLELIDIIAGKGNPAALTDLGVGNLLTWAGLQGAGLNVRINLPYIKDSDLKSQYTEEIAHLLAFGKNLYISNRERIDKELCF